MTVFEIETPRLRLRPVRRGDEGDLFELVSDEQTCLDDGGFHAFSQRGPAFDALFDRFTRQLRYAIEHRGKVIGMVHLMEADRAVPCYELGYVLHPSFRGRGLAREAVAAVIREWFARTDTRMFLAKCTPYNVPSRKLIQGLGFEYEGRQHKALNHALLGPVDLECWYLERI